MLFRTRRSIRSRSERRAYTREVIERVRALDAALVAVHQAEVEATSGSLWDRMRAHKRCEIAVALVRNGYSRTHTARELRMSRRALLNNIAALDLKTRLAVRKAARLNP
jgi:DNA-binding NtrC family response regulator